MPKKQIPELCINKKSCCGCMACRTVCPMGAIAMDMDEKGFLYPSIDEDLCIRCGKCISVCAFKEDAMSDSLSAEVAAYAVRAKDDAVIANSSSGGVFTVISDWVMEQQGAVASAVYDYDSHTLRYQLYTDKQTRDAARGSKYIQPELGDIYDRCVSWIKENPDKPLLFVGLGCQTAGFRRILHEKKVANQAILVDIICHGTPSSQLWRDYIHGLEEEHGAAAEYITFKDKRNGWNNPYAYARIEGKEIPLCGYGHWFYDNLSQRDSCFSCPYTKLRRDSDLTIGDFWGIEDALPGFYSKKGNSLVLIQSKKGAALFESVREALWCEATTLDKCLQPRLETPGKENPRRDRFWKDYQRRGVAYLQKRYREDGKAKQYLKRGIRKIKRVARKVFVNRRSSL